MNVEDLPAARELVAIVRTAIEAHKDPSRALDPYAPAIDTLANAEQAGAFVGLSTASVYQERSRKNADGSPRWPASDVPAGRSAFWTYRTIVLHRAAMPGNGHDTRKVRAGHSLDAATPAR